MVGGAAAGVNRYAAGKPCFSCGSFQFSELGRRREGESASLCSSAVCVNPDAVNKDGDPSHRRY